MTTSTLPDFKLGYDTVALGPNYRLMADRSNIGALALELVSRGKGMPRNKVPLGWTTQRFGDFVARRDLAHGQVIYCRDVGQDGSYWRYDDDLKLFVVDRDFDLVRVSGSGSAPVSTINGPAAGFNQFSPGVTMPNEFWSTGARRIVCEGDILRTTGTTGTTPHTQIVADDGTAPIFDAQWTSGAVLHHFESVFWVSGTNQVSQSGRLTFSPTPPAAGTVALSLNDVALTSLFTVTRPLRVGIKDVGGQTGLFKLINFRARVVA